MRTHPYLTIPAFRVVLCVATAGLCGTGLKLQASAQLPATAPTAVPSSAAGGVAPLAATPDTLATHRPEVTCSGGLLTVHANNSSLNGILRAIARCNGMHIIGGVADQRVFGDYGPAAPATVLATLIDGTGTNMLLRETAADQPADLILTPRAGGASPPPPASSLADEDDDQSSSPASGRALAPGPQGPYGMRSGAMPAQRPGMHGAGRGLDAPANQPPSGSAVSSPPSIPQPFNNVNGSPNNTSPTASTYPTTNSVPLDSVATPSTTPSSNGIVDAPNPPATGSDTAAAMNGNQGAASSGNANQTGAQGGQNSTSAPTDLTPEQIFQQLQQREQQQQQQQTPQPSGGPIIGGAI